MRTLAITDMKKIDRYFKQENIKYDIVDNIIKPKLTKSKTIKVFRSLTELNLNSSIPQLVSIPESKEKYIEIFNSTI